MIEILLAPSNNLESYINFISKSSYLVSNAIFFIYLIIIP
jgi:hypothetical protein